MNPTIKQLLSLLGILSLTVGCITLGAKKAAQSKAASTAAELKVVAASDSATTYKTVDEYLKRVGSTCPKVLENMSQNPNPNRFSYMLDTTDTPACRAARSIEDLIGDGRLFELSKYNEIKQDREGKYHQYHKGILVEDTRIEIWSQTRTGKIYNILGGYYPSLNVDTSKISRDWEKISLEIVKAIDFDPYFSAWATKDFLRQYTPIIDPATNSLVYEVPIHNKMAKNPGIYRVDALTGNILSYEIVYDSHISSNMESMSVMQTQALANNCYNCLGLINDACLPCDALNCTAFSATESLLNLPTLHNGCQPIPANKCVDGSNIYRINPVVSHFENPYYYLSYDKDINVYDASNYYVVTSGQPPAAPLELKLCDINPLHEYDAIAVSAYYGIQQARTYFINRNIDHPDPIAIYCHVPDNPFNNDPYNGAAWSQSSNKRFDIGDGDGIEMNAAVTVDVLAHEYGHRILYNKFSIGTATPDAQAIHEGVADIFSVLVRHYVAPNDPIDWRIGDLVAINTDNLPRDLAHPENTNPPQALYYYDQSNFGYWNPLPDKPYNHAGIIAKWFYLLTNGGTGSHFPDENVPVSGVGIDFAEQVVIQGLAKLKQLDNTTPTYEEFAKATVDVAPFITDVCNLKKSVVRAWKAVGLLLNEPEDRLAAYASCHVDLYMRDNHWDIGKEPNVDAIMPSFDGIYGTEDDWEAIWESPDLWNCPATNLDCLLENWSAPTAVYDNRIGFNIYNSDPSLNSDPALLHIYYAMASTGESWPDDWISNFTDPPGYTCRLGNELAYSPVTIPSIAPGATYTGWITWSPPNFLNPELGQYMDPDICELSLDYPDEGDPRYEMCLLARLESEQDPIIGEDEGLIANIMNSNNIVTRNTFVINPGIGLTNPNNPDHPIIVGPGRPSVILVANNNEIVKNLDVVFESNVQANLSQSLTGVLDIRWIMSEEMWTKWESTGKQGEGIQIIGDKEVKITDLSTAKLLNIPFESKEYQPLATKVTLIVGDGSGKSEFPIETLPDQFSFRITHRSSDSSPINKPSSCLFYVRDIQKTLQQPTANFAVPQLECQPNPFSDNTRIRVYLPTTEPASLMVYNLQGQCVRVLAQGTNLSAGSHYFDLSAEGLSDGLYLCRLITAHQSTQKLLLAR